MWREYKYLGIHQGSGPRLLDGAGHLTVRRRDRAAVKADTQAIYQAASRSEAEGQAQAFAHRWRDAYPQLMPRWLRDLPELPAFFHCPRPLWRRLRTANVIEHCFVEVRRRTRPMVCFVKVQNVERFNLEWHQRTLRQFTQVA